MRKSIILTIVFLFILNLSYVLAVKNPQLKLAVNLTIDDSTFQNDESFFKIPTKLVTDIQGNIFVLDSNRVLKFSNKGNFLLEINKKGVGPSESTNLQDIDIDIKNGILYLCDQNLQKILTFTTDGKYLKEFRLKLGSNPYKIAVDKQGFVYVNFIGTPQNYLLHRFSPDGSLVNSIIPIRFKDEDASLSAWKNNIQFCLDKNGNILVSYCFYNIVQKVKPNGNVIREWKLPLDYTPKDVKIVWPSPNRKKADGDRVTQGIAVDNFNNIYIMWGSRATEKGLEIDVFNQDCSFKTRFFSNNKPDGDLLVFHIDDKNNLFMLIPLENPSITRNSIQWVK